MTTPGCCLPWLSTALFSGRELADSCCVQREAEGAAPWTLRAQGWESQPQSRHSIGTWQAPQSRPNSEPFALGKTVSRRPGVACSRRLRGGPAAVCQGSGTVELPLTRQMLSKRTFPQSKGPLSRVILWKPPHSRRPGPPRCSRSGRSGWAGTQLEAPGPVAAPEGLGGRAGGTEAAARAGVIC